MLGVYIALLIKWYCQNKSEQLQMQVMKDTYLYIYCTEIGQEASYFLCMADRIDMVMST